MKVHHLNLCTMCPFGGSLVSGDDRGVFTRGEMIIHALLVETDKEGLVLVDTGLGLDDMRSSVSRLGRGFLVMANPTLGEEHTAIRQIERLGFSAKDVRHVVCTHLDVDHAGGLPDFPDAKVHVHTRERDAAIARSTFKEKERYKPVHFAHSPNWETHEEGGDKWFGFDSVQAIADDVLMLPLPGHTRGHCAIAVRAPAEGGTQARGVEWLLHCGDAYFFQGELAETPTCPAFLAGFQSYIAFDDAARRANQKRLRALKKEEGARVKLFSAHCPHEYRAITESRT